jgi:Family of unknown function (DUF6152)
MRPTPAPLLTLLAVAPAVALAHHSWSGYDSSKVLTLTGTIREVGYEHPHGFVKLALWRYRPSSPRFSMREDGASTTSQILPGVSPG